MITLSDGFAGQKSICQLFKSEDNRMAIENLLINSGFESNDSWRLNLGASIVNNNAYEGSRCLAFLSKGTSATQYCHQSVRVVRGKSYVLSFYAKHTGNMRVWMSVGYMISATEQRHVYDINLHLTSTYQKYNLPFVMPMDTYSDTVEIGIMGGYGPNTGDAAWVDKAEFIGERPISEADGNIQIGRPYYADVVCTSDGLKVREEPNPNSGVIGYWPNGRLAVIEAIPGNDTWVRCHWKNSTAYVMKKYLKNYRDAYQKSWSELVVDVANQELGVTNHALKYYGPNYTDKFYNWCHYFSDWLVGHCIWQWATIPEVDNCKSGVIHFLDKKLFIFANAWHKAEVYDHCTETKQHMNSRELKNYEIAHIPDCGDYVYFRKNFYDDEGYDNTETSYHVGVIVGVERIGQGYKLYIAQGNTNGTYNSSSYKILSYSPTPKAEKPDLYNERFHPKILGFGLAIDRG